MFFRNAAFVCMLVLALLLSACAAPGADLSGEWTLVLLNGQEPLAGTTVTAVFEDGRVGGQAGCNSYSGSYSASGKALSVSGVVQTLMACMEPAGVMDQETAFLQTLSLSASFSTAGDTLEIMDAAGETILIFSRAQ